MRVDRGAGLRIQRRQQVVQRGDLLVGLELGGMRTWACRPVSTRTVRAPARRSPTKSLVGSSPTYTRSGHVPPSCSRIIWKQVREGLAASGPNAQVR